MANNNTNNNQFGKYGWSKDSWFQKNGQIEGWETMDKNAQASALREKANEYHSSHGWAANVPGSASYKTHQAMLDSASDLSSQGYAEYGKPMENGKLDQWYQGLAANGGLQETPYGNEAVNARLAQNDYMAVQNEQRQVEELRKEMKRRGLGTSNLDYERDMRIRETTARAQAAGRAQILDDASRQAAQIQMENNRLVHSGIQSAMSYGLSKEQLEIAKQQAEDAGNFELGKMIGRVIEAWATDGLSEVYRAKENGEKK